MRRRARAEGLLEVHVKRSEADHPIENDNIVEIDQSAERAGRGTWWRAQIRLHQSGGDCETLKDAILQDFVNGTVLGAFVAGIAFACILQQVDFSQGPTRDLPWMTELLITTGWMDWAVVSGKVAFVGSFMTAIWLTVRCVYASCFKTLLFIQAAPGNVVDTMCTFLDEKEFGHARWYHLSPVFNGIKACMVGACVGVLFNYGVFPFTPTFFMVVYMHNELEFMKTKFDKSVKRWFDRSAEGWADRNQRRD